MTTPPLDIIMRDNRKAVTRICRSYAHDHQEAEDYAQEVWLRVWRNLSKFQGDSAFSTWLYQVATNTCRSLRAMPAYRPGGMSGSGGGKLEAGCHGGGPLLCQPEEFPEGQDDETPDLMAEAGQRARLLEVTLAAIPAEQCEAYTLFVVQDWSQDDIARHQRVPVGTVKSRISRARAAIERAL